MSREEGNKLLNALLPFAQQMLAKHRKFHPFGAFLNDKGEVVLLAAYEGNEHPPSNELINLMIEAMRKDAPEKGYQAVGICFDVLIALPKEAKKSDAIQVAIEYSDGEAMDVYLPYQKKWFGKVRYGKIIASAADSKIFKKSH
jgi:hypothetical protein